MKSFLLKKNNLLLLCLLISACKSQTRESVIVRSSNTEHHSVNKDSLVSQQVERKVKEKLLRYESSLEIMQEKYLEGEQIKLFEDLDFDKGEWKMVFFPQPHFLSGVLNKKKIQSELNLNLTYPLSWKIPMSTLDELLQNNNLYQDFLSQHSLKYFYPCRELKDKNIMKSIRRNLAMAYKKGMPGTTNFTLCVFQDSLLRFEAQVILNNNAFLSTKHGYTYSNQNNILREFLDGFEPIDYDLAYFWNIKLER